MKTAALSTMAKYPEGALDKRGFWFNRIDLCDRSYQQSEGPSGWG